MFGFPVPLLTPAVKASAASGIDLKIFVIIYHNLYFELNLH
jgi:hypothetical protein